MSDDTTGWFDEAGREGAPSAKFNEVGDSVVGEVVDKYKIDYIPFGKKDPATDERTGEVIKQLVIVLQTDLRDWEGVSKVPTDADGNKKPASADDGRRAIYARKFTNIYGALGKAIKDSGVENPSVHPAVGGKFGVQFYDEEDTGKGNPLKKFRAKYTPPAPKKSDDGWFDGEKGDSAETRPQDSKPAEGGETTKKSTVTDEPPF